MARIAPVLFFSLVLPIIALLPVSVFASTDAAKAEDEGDAAEVIADVSNVSDTDGENNEKEPAASASAMDLELVPITSEDSKVADAEEIAAEADAEGERDYAEEGRKERAKKQRFALSSDEGLAQNGAAPLMTRGGFNLSISGYVRAILTHIDFDESESDFIGRNDGFSLANARFGLEGEKDRARFELSLEGAVASVSRRNTSEGSVIVRVADAVVAYEVIPNYMELQVGQQKVPFDGESLISNAKLPFIHNSVWHRGIKGVEGFNVTGLEIGREVGVTFAGDRMPLVGDDIALSYALALTNGSPANQPLNENMSLASYGRLEGHYKDMVTLGVAVYQGTRTHGVLPDLLDERNVGFAADLAASVARAWLRLDLAYVAMDYPGVSMEPERVSLGLGASFGVLVRRNVEAAYRLAFYDPTFEFRNASPALAAQLEANDLMYHTVGLSWLPSDQPIGARINYTLTQENPDRSVRNDRLEVLAKLVF